MNLPAASFFDSNQERENITRTFRYRTRGPAEGGGRTASMPMTASLERHRFVRIDLGRGADEMLRSPDEVIGMRAPRVSRRTVQHYPDAAIRWEIISVAVTGLSDANRFASRPEG
jgi:hypothetical protein